jgi:hypothetical protein
VDAAFGLLGASDEVYQAYIDKVDEFVGGLASLGAGIGHVAGALADDADAYDSADALLGR